ncbi:hypothetical protein Glove_457g74 [Diversispora epigaea]|uniref:Uncharacterized protein n=1 Tax=Diversispora epigaea TaxID=1348612 RepID=A0A397GP15_9GLOM|nr:hypothetical protein Glove_457g74 [Diversispora epigaea]
MENFQQKIEALLALARKKQQEEQSNQVEVRINETIPEEKSSLKDIWRKMGSADSSSTPDNGGKNKKRTTRPKRLGPGKKYSNKKLNQTNKMDIPTLLEKLRCSNSPTIGEVDKENIPPFLYRKKFDSKTDSPCSSSAPSSPPSSPLGSMVETHTINYFHQYANINSSNEVVINKSIDYDMMDVDTPCNRNRSRDYMTTNILNYEDNENLSIITSDEEGDEDDSPLKQVKNIKSKTTTTNISIITPTKINRYFNVPAAPVRNTPHNDSAVRNIYYNHNHNVTPPNKNGDIAGYFSIEKGKFKETKIITHNSLNDASPDTRRILEAAQNHGSGRINLFSGYVMENPFI